MLPVVQCRTVVQQVRRRSYRSSFRTTTQVNLKPNYTTKQSTAATPSPSSSSSSLLSYSLTSPFTSSSLSLSLSFSTFPNHHHDPLDGSKNDENDKIDTTRSDILQAALTKVHEYGWSDDAIAAAVVSKGLPITMTGLVNTSDLISFCMQTANEQFRRQLEQDLIPRWTTLTATQSPLPPPPTTTTTTTTTPTTANSITTSLPDRIAQAIQARLTFILPYVKSRTWHDGMALGAMPYNIVTTQEQLQEMLRDLTQAVLTRDGGTTIHNPQWGPLEQAAVGALYVATELHLLTDTSPDYIDTWIFLRQRVTELDMLANMTKSTTDKFGGVFPSGSNNQLEDTLLVASALASSLAGAVVSLTLPSPSSVRAVRTAVETTTAIVPQWIHQVVAPRSNAGVRQPDGTQPSDYDIVPPFPSSNSFSPHDLQSNTDHLEPLLATESKS